MLTRCWLHPLGALSGTQRARVSALRQFPQRISVVRTVDGLPACETLNWSCALLGSSRLSSCLHSQAAAATKEPMSLRPQLPPWKRPLSHRRRRSPSHLPPDQPIDAAQAVTRFYKLVGSFRFASAWDLYPASARDEAGSLDHWREGYRTTIETVPHNVTVLASSTDAVQVGVDIESKDRDLCGGPPITQTFSGSWSFVRSGRDLVPQGLAIEKTGGVAPTTNRSDCPGDGGRSFKELGGGGGYGGGSGVAVAATVRPVTRRHRPTITTRRNTRPAVTGRSIAVRSALRTFLLHPEIPMAWMRMATESAARAKSAWRTSRPPGFRWPGRTYRHQHGETR